MTLKSILIPERILICLLTFYVYGTVGLNYLTMRCAKLIILRVIENQLNQCFTQNFIN